MPHSLPFIFAVLASVWMSLLGRVAVLASDPSESSSTADPAPTEVLAGHSQHGEVFNEGPRQAASLIPGTGKIKFEVTSDVPLVQKFVEQGIGQLHGFWYFEAERSFRQAAMLDPGCAIAYWGMARANTDNAERAKGFIERAVALTGKASPREQRYIGSLHEFLTSGQPKKEREARYVESLEALAKDYPDDLEAKALLGYALYRYRASAKKTHSEVDVVLDQVLAKERLHPVHHYRIHLWDHKSPQRALDSAAKCGPSARGIAHMWHMCGHIFSRVRRFGDAAWFQEASARVDHRHMMQARVLPDQIHNFAHNNEWLIRNLINVGRVDDALDLAKNMIELPRHPKYNSLDKRNSASYGRDRLLNVLNRYELWEELIDLAHRPYLEPTNKPAEQVKRLRYLGKAYARTGKIEPADELRQQLESRLQEAKAAQAAFEAETDTDASGTAEQDERDESEPTKEDKDKAADDKQRKKKRQEHKKNIEQIERALACVSGYMALAENRYAEALSLLQDADEDKLAIAQVQLLVGDVEQAVEQARDYAKERKQQVQPLAGLTDVYWKAGLRGEALESFIHLRSLSRWTQLNSPVFARLEPIAQELGFPADWRVRQPRADDLGEQPPLDSLGPFRWQPGPAEDWLLPDSDGQLHSLRAHRGQPLLLIFYLGYGCLHCAEQLHALAPKTDAFAQQGISIVAISSDGLEGLLRSQEDYDGEKIPFPLVANPNLDVFKAYRAYDDFEDLPLHGTFLIDAHGRVRWQDISYDPFMDVDFLLAEAQRLLAQIDRADDRSQHIKGRLAAADKLPAADPK